MAEAVCKGPEAESAAEKHVAEKHECAVCLQPCVHPAQLPCGHIFCFLCVKGIANQSKKCAMCRQEIPRDFIDQPNLLDRPALETSEGYDGGYQWFYEGRNGWWQYDERTSKELETSYKEGERTCELLIAGFLYIVDLENMVQLRRNEPSRRRNIKRDFATIPKKGIAGLRTDDSTSEGSENRPIEGRTHHNELPVTPSNTPQSPTSGRESPRNVERDSQAIVDLISSLNLDSAINELVDDDEDEDTLTAGTSSSSSSVCNKGHNHFKFPSNRK